MVKLKNFQCRALNHYNCFILILTFIGIVPMNPKIKTQFLLIAKGKTAKCEKNMEPKSQMG